MSDQVKNEQLESTEGYLLQAMAESGELEIVPCCDPFDVRDLKDKSQFTQLELSSAQKMHISALMQHMPSTLAAGGLAQAYRVKFPQGLPHTLMSLNQGGFGSAILENGKIAGTASFYTMTAQATVAGAFTAMSVVSGMYFLTQINRELRIVRMKLDEILAFLYGDKHAELVAEIKSVQYAYKNYVSIMSHEQQRIATITSLQRAKKVAMQDIEFYINDLKSKVNRQSKNYKDYYALKKTTNESIQIKDSLELSQQLYVLSSILETYFAQNQDPEYLHATEEDMQIYIDKCNDRILEYFGFLKGRICAFKGKGNKADLERRVDKLIGQLKGNGGFSMRKALYSALYAPVERKEYYLSRDGNVYMLNE